MKAATIRRSYPAHQLTPPERKALALKVIQNNAPISDVARQSQVSRKFIYTQKNKALMAIDTEFTKADDADVLFYIPVTKRWLLSLILCLLLHCRSSVRGVQKVFSDMLEHSVSLGRICELANEAAANAHIINTQQDLSAIKTATPDEIFQNNQPILAGVDARSLYCYLLTKEEHRDADTWAIHLMDLEKQGFNPERFIADNGSGLRLGHQMAYPNTPCDGDIFHMIKELMDMRRFFRNQYKSALSNWILLDSKIKKRDNAKNHLSNFDSANEAQRHAQQMCFLSTTIDTLVSWLQHDVFQLAGLDQNARSELYDFIVSELKILETQHPHRVKNIRISLENQKTSLLAFTHILDAKFETISEELNCTKETVWEMCELLRCHEGSDKHAIRCLPLLCALGDDRFEKLEEAVILAMSTTDKTSCMIENFNSRLRPYFFLRKGVHNNYLHLLQFYLNHTPLLRSEQDYRRAKTPTQIMTNKTHPHWLEMLGLSRFKKEAA